MAGSAANNSRFFCIFHSLVQAVVLRSGLCTDVTRRLESEIKPVVEDQDDNLITNNVIAMIQSRMNKDTVKKSLDDFTMVRRKTHFSIPGIIENGSDVNVETDKKIVDPKYTSNTINPIYSNHIATPTYYENNNNLNEININNYTKEINSKENDIEYEDLIDVKVNNDMDFLYNKYKENNFENVLTYDQETELLKVLRKQKELLKNIKETAKKDKKKDIVKNDKAVKNKGGKVSKGDKNKNIKKDKAVTKKSSKNDKTTKKKNNKSDKTDKKNNKTDKNKDGKKGKTKNVTKTPDTKKKTNKVTKKDTKTTKKQVTKKDAKTTKKQVTKKDTKTTKKQATKTQNKITNKPATQKSTKKPVKKEKPTTKSRSEIMDFDDIVAEIEKKNEYAKRLPNYTPFTFETTTTLQTTQPTTTTPETTTRYSTVLTILNEIDVRSALRNDPYVKRILKMANRKRQKYYKKALINIVN